MSEQARRIGTCRRWEPGPPGQVLPRVRLASALPLLLLVAGLVLIQQHYDLQQIQAAAEIDSALLSDAKYTVGGLVLHSRVPPSVEMDDMVSRHKIQAHPASF